MRASSKFYTLCLIYVKTEEKNIAYNHLNGQVETGNWKVGGNELPSQKPPERFRDSSDLILGKHGKWKLCLCLHIL